MEHKTLLSQNTIGIKLNPKIYSLEVIYGACYVFVDRAYLFLDGDPKKEIKAFIKGKQKMPQKKLEALAGEFKNELLNYALREKIAKNNKKIREYIIGKALYYDTSEMLGEDGSKLDELEDDPLGIAIPWEKKHGKS